MLPLLLYPAAAAVVLSVGRRPVVDLPCACCVLDRRLLVCAALPAAVCRYYPPGVIVEAVPRSSAARAHLYYIIAPHRFNWLRH